MACVGGGLRGLNGSRMSIGVEPVKPLRIGFSLRLHEVPGVVAHLAVCAAVGAYWIGGSGRGGEVLFHTESFICGRVLLLWRTNSNKQYILL